MQIRPLVGIPSPVGLCVIGGRGFIGGVGQWNGMGVAGEPEASPGWACQPCPLSRGGRWTHW